MLIPEAFVRHRSLGLARIAEAASPVLQALARGWCGPVPRKDNWRRGVLIGSNHMGDVLCRTGSLPALCEGFPKCEWDFLAHGAGAEILKNNPHLHGVVEASNRLDKETIRRLRDGNYDVAVCYDAVSYYRALLLAVSARIPARVAFVHKGMSGLVTHPVDITFPRPFAVYFREMVGQLVGRSPEWSVGPEIFPDEQDVVIAKGVWESLGLNPGRVVVACMPFTRQTVGVWPAENFARTLAALHRSMECESVLIGGRDDRGALEDLKQSFHLPSTVTAGEMNLRALAVFLRRCALAFAADSGPRHLANASGIPVAFVRNTSVLAVETGTYLPTTEIDFVSETKITMEGPRSLTPEQAAARLKERLKD